MTKEKRLEAFEKAIKPEEDQEVFHSIEYKNQAEWDKAIGDYKAGNPKHKPKIITHTRSCEDEAGEITTRTMFKKDRPRYEHLSNDELDKGYREVFKDDN